MDSSVIVASQSPPFRHEEEPGVPPRQRGWGRDRGGPRYLRFIPKEDRMPLECHSVELRGGPFDRQQIVIDCLTEVAKLPDADDPLVLHTYRVNLSRKTASYEE